MAGVVIKKILRSGGCMSKRGSDWDAPGVEEGDVVECGIRPKLLPHRGWHQRNCILKNIRQEIYAKIGVRLIV